MQAQSSKEITQLLIAWSEGDESALDQLTPLIHTELHRLAHHYMSRERTGHLLQTSALVNEAYVRLIDWKNVRWQNRAHFFAVAAQMMRRILVDFARERQSLKHGGGTFQVSLTEAASFLVHRDTDLVALDEAVRRAGDKINIGVRLIHAATEENLWAGSYSRDLRDVLTVQSEVATAITQAIQIKLTPQEQSRLARARPINPVAYDDFLRGRYYLNRQTKADSDVAVQALNRAVTSDPEFAAGWAELAQAYVWRLFLFAPDEKDLHEKAFVAVEKALALDPDLAEAYLARGRLLWTPANHFPHDKAIQEYRRALALNPSLDEARNQLALVLSHVGLVDEALAELNKALATNPSNILARFRVGEVLLFQGKHEQALEALRNVPTEVNPSLVGHQIVFALLSLGRKEEAAATLEKFLKEYPSDNRGLFTSLQAILAASEGQHREAEEKIQSAIERGKGFGHSITLPITSHVPMRS